MPAFGEPGVLFIRMCISTHGAYHSVEYRRLGALCRMHAEQYSVRTAAFMAVH